MTGGGMPGRYPAVVKSYDQAKRTCRVEIPGLTDGGDVYPEAEIEYPIGDKAKSGSRSTEIAMSAGDTVWVAFIGGDPRHPIITGNRNPSAGNGTDWRRFHHTNLELIAEAVMRLVATGAITIKSDSLVTIDAPLTTLTGAVMVQGLLTYAAGMSGTGGGPGTAISGDIIQTGGIMSSNGKVLDSHTHGGVTPGGAHTSPPD